MASIVHLESAARRKLSAPEAWKSYRWEVLAGGYLVTGAVPVGLYKSGPRKGRPKWEGRGTKVVLSEMEVGAEVARYIQETGNCANCLGTKEEFLSWSVTEGTKRRPCSECNATGKAKGTS